jgi:hypothetical protein
MTWYLLFEGRFVFDFMTCSRMTRALISGKDIKFMILNDLLIQILIIHFLLIWLIKTLIAAYSTSSNLTVLMRLYIVEWYGNGSWSERKLLLPISKHSPGETEENHDKTDYLKTGN